MTRIEFFFLVNSPVLGFPIHQGEQSMPTFPSSEPSVALDAPVEVRGYATDPKSVGYQILTNYESTYWRALVGNDAWGLYEILRSFCHDGHRTCYPSIRLLVAMLGFK